MQAIMIIKVEGFKEEPYTEICREEYSKIVDTEHGGMVLIDEIKEIFKRYQTITHLEFSAKAKKPEPRPFQGEIPEKILKEAERLVREKSPQN